MSISVRHNLTTNTVGTWRDCKIDSRWSNRNKLTRQLIFSSSSSFCCCLFGSFFHSDKIVWAIFKIYPSLLPDSFWVWIRIWYWWVWWALLGFFCSLLNFYYPYSEGFLGIFYGCYAVLFLYLFPCLSCRVTLMLDCLWV